MFEAKENCRMRKLCQLKPGVNLDKLGSSVVQKLQGFLPRIHGVDRAVKGDPVGQALPLAALKNIHSFSPCELPSSCADRSVATYFTCLNSNIANLSKQL